MLKMNQSKPAYSSYIIVDPYFMLKVVVAVEPVLQGQIGEDIGRLGNKDLSDGFELEVLVFGPAAVAGDAADESDGLALSKQQGSTSKIRQNGFPRHFKR